MPGFLFLQGRFSLGSGQVPQLYCALNSFRRSFENQDFIVGRGEDHHFSALQELLRPKNVMPDDLSRRQKAQYIHMSAGGLFVWEKLQGYATSQG